MIIISVLVYVDMRLCGRGRRGSGWCQLVGKTTSGEFVMGICDNIMLLLIFYNDIYLVFSLLNCNYVINR